MVVHSKANQLFLLRIFVSLQLRLSCSLIYLLLMSFPVFKAAIKGKLQELGAYVGNISHIISH